MYNKRTCGQSEISVTSVLCKEPQAVAEIKGSPKYSGIYGTVRFYQTRSGVIVYAEVNGLPKGKTNCENKIFGFHIHEGSACCGDEKDPFSYAESHYNPNNCEHPHHAGDLPPLFGNNGFALLIFLTNRFCVDEIIDKTIIVHDKPDDFTSQPSGNSGTKIACGVIKAIPYKKCNCYR